LINYQNEQIYSFGKEIKVGKEGKANQMGSLLDFIEEIRKIKEGSSRKAHDSKKAMEKI